MLKKNLIIIFLLSLYTTVLAHNAIPHRHFETVESHTHHDHHSSDVHYHTFLDHEQEEEKNKNSDDNTDHPFLALHLLIGHTEQLYINQAGIDLTVKVKQIVGHIPVAKNIFFLTKIPESDSPGSSTEPEYSFLYQYYLGLRAPPALA